MSAPLEAIVEFLQIDEDLIDIAVEASPDLGEGEPGEIGEWIASLPVPAKDELLGRVASGGGAGVQALLLRQFRESLPRRPAVEGAPARTAGELRDAAAAYGAEIAKAVEERGRAEAAEEEVRKTAAYARHLDDLSAREGAAWVRAAALIEAKNQRDCDTAVTLLRDLRALAERNGSLEVFTRRIGDLRRQHQRKPSLMERSTRRAWLRGSSLTATRSSCTWARHRPDAHRSKPDPITEPHALFVSYRPISARRPTSHRATRRPWSTPVISELRKCTPSQTRALTTSSVIVFQSM